MLPVGAGAVAGFWAADQGMRLLPTLAELVLAWGVVALLLIGLGAALRGKLYVDTPHGRSWRRRAIVLLGLGALAASVRLAMWRADQADLARLSPAEFEAAFAIDKQRYADDRTALKGLVARLEVEGIPPRGDNAVLTADDEAKLLDAWVALHDYAIDLDQVRAYWEGYYAYDPSRAERAYHLRAYLLTYAAELTLYAETAQFTALVLRNDNARKYLDAPHPEQGLGASSLSHLREDVLGARDQARVVAGERYLTALAVGAGARDEARQLGVDALWLDIEAAQAQITRESLLDRAAVTVAADAQELRRGVKHVWFPVQAETAEWMGDERVRRVGRYLIPEEQQNELDAKLEPGDVMVARKNWYLSNLGLPGFWPHGLLYIGDPEKLSAWGTDAEVQAWIASETGTAEPLDVYLAHRFPRDWAAYQLGQEGHPIRTIEAISEGISLSAFPHVTGDYVAALRPRLSKAEKARAIVAAFSHLGKPYDFDFDFATDHALVCTELVWRCYHAPEGSKGVEWPLVPVAGRMTLPANEMVKQWAESAGTEAQQLDFVAFIDASEKEQRTFFSDEAAFRESWKRPKWDLMQE
ncbi:hypothetical protein LBMAG42_50830 [Deltaproteobacteria bacterium]|nr:hypothetical protein LBMAG42_50830 [Deltaproteobacteria bacterium]